MLIRDGYAGYTHLPGAVHAWCGAPLVRDLQGVYDAEPEHQLWAKGMADNLHAARRLRDRAVLPLHRPKRGHDSLDVLRQPCTTGAWLHQPQHPAEQLRPRACPVIVIELCLTSLVVVASHG